MSKQKNFTVLDMLAKRHKMEQSPVPMRKTAYSEEFVKQFCKVAVDLGITMDGACEMLNELVITKHANIRSSPDSK